MANTTRVATEIKIQLTSNRSKKTREKLEAFKKRVNDNQHNNPKSAS